MSGCVIRIGLLVKRLTGIPLPDAGDVKNEIVLIYAARHSFDAAAEGLNFFTPSASLPGASGSWGSGAYLSMM